MQTCTRLVGRLARNTRRLRCERGWSLRALAQRVGVSPTTILNIEDRRLGSVSLKTLAGLCRAFGVEADALLERKPTASPTRSTSEGT
jgi:transcriptional regulator with XRE-family HTH domain